MRRVLAALAIAAVAVLPVINIASPASSAVAKQEVPITKAQVSGLEEPLAWYPVPRWHAYLWAIENARGCVYTWGGAGPCWHGYDCSGLVVTAYAHVGIWLPHNTDQMLWSGRLTRISANQLRPGDLVFMYPDSAGGAGHVALYTGWWGWVFGAHTFGELSGFSRWSNLYGFYHVNGAR